MTRRLAMALALAGAALASCNAVLGIDEARPLDAGSDGSVTDGGLGDVVTEALTDTSSDAVASACDPTKPFSAPTLVPNVNTGQAPLSAHLLPDELTMILSASVVGGSDIFSSTRPSTLATFGAPVLLAGANTAATQVTPSLMGDGLTMYFASSRQPLSDGGANFDIYVATRPTVTSSFLAPFPVDALNGPQAEGSPFVATNGRTIYFTSTRSGFNAIYRSSLLPVGGTFDTPTPATELNAGDDGAPVVSADELTIFFSSRRGMGSGGDDIWTARRATTAGPFDAPTVVSELNTPGNDTPAWVSADRCRIYLVSDRASDGGVGLGTTIWQAARPK